MNIAFCYLGLEGQVDYLMSLLSCCFLQSFGQEIICLNLTDSEGRYRYRREVEQPGNVLSEKLCFLNCGDVESYWGRLMLREADFCILVVSQTSRHQLEKYLERPLLRKHQIIYAFMDYPEGFFRNRYHLEESCCYMIPINAEFSQFYDQGILRERMMAHKYHLNLHNELLYQSVWQLSFQIRKIADKICSEQREDLFYERSF